MSLLDAYEALMESATWKHRASIDQYGDPTFSSSTISVAWFDEKRFVRSEKGDMLQQVYSAMTTSAIEAGDIISIGGYDWPIANVDIIKNMGGEQYRIATFG
jgi:hypothetical protein